ncbi:MAG: pirin family protein, partial [Bacilli bacterium]
NKGNVPNYGDVTYEWALRTNQWLPIITGDRGGVATLTEATIRIEQDANVYVTELSAGEKLTFPVGVDRMAYVVQIEGESRIEDITLTSRDALESIAQSMTFEAVTQSHFLVVEMGR